MIHYEETTADHIKEIKAQPEQSNCHGIGEAIDGGVSETMFAGDIPIAAYGIVSLWEGNAQIWALLSEQATDVYPLALSRRVRDMLEDMIDGLELVRVQAEARCDHDKAKEWLEWLGFSVEGVMECYGPEDQADYYMMSRITNPEA